MNPKRNLGIHKGLSQLRDLLRREGVELILQLLLLELIIAAVAIIIVVVVIAGGGEMGGAPVGAVEDGGGSDVDESDGVGGAEVVLDGPLDGEGALVAKIDRDGDFAGGGVGGEGGGG